MNARFILINIGKSAIKQILSKWLNISPDSVKIFLEEKDRYLEIEIPLISVKDLTDFTMILNSDTIQEITSEFKQYNIKILDWQIFTRKTDLVLYIRLGVIKNEC